MTDRALFITFEGGEGAGKTTLISRLELELRKQGGQILVTREPGGTELGKQIRRLLLHKEPSVQISPHAELLLFLADRAQHLDQVIKPALLKGVTVLCDRFNDSTIAYQGYARGLGVEAVEQLCKLVCGDSVPDLTFYLDIDPKLGMERAIRQQRVMDRMETEQIAFHEKVRQGFLKIADKDKPRVCVIDARQSADKVFEQAFAVIENKFKRKGAKTQREKE